MSKLVAAIDVGASWSRGVLVEVENESVTFLSSGAGGSGNANRIGMPAASANVNSFLLSLLASSEVSGRDISSLCIAGAVQETGLAAASLCPNATMLALHDTFASYRSGTENPNGIVTIAGTGSMATRFRDGRPVASAGGWGWLLGDEGGGIHLGKQGFRACLTALDGGPDTALLADVAAVSGYEGDLHSEALQAKLYEYVYRTGTISEQLSLFAPRVSAAARAGDNVAQKILDGSAVEIATLAKTLAEPGDSVVLAGAVAVELSNRILPLLHDAYDTTVVIDGVPGALALALEAVGEHPPLVSLAESWNAIRPSFNP